MGQEEILKILEKHKKTLNMWVAQFEIIDIILKNSNTKYVSVCDALKDIRRFKEIPFLEIHSGKDGRNCHSLRLVLKKVRREDLLEKRNSFKGYKGITFIYKIK